MKGVRSAVLIALLIVITISMVASIYYGVIIKSSFTDWHYPTTIAFIASCVTITCSLTYVYMTRIKDNPSLKSLE